MSTEKKTDDFDRVPITLRVPRALLELFDEEAAIQYHDRNQHFTELLLSHFNMLVTSEEFARKFLKSDSLFRPIAAAAGKK
jgi:hypothetical protein